MGVASGKYIFEQPLKEYWEAQEARGKDVASQPQPQQQAQQASKQQEALHAERPA